MKERQAFDDLIFERRNRDYGAYTLRKDYNSRVLKSLVIAVVIGSLLIIIPYLRVIGKKDEIATQNRVRYVSVQMEELVPPKAEIIIPPEAPPPQATAQKAIKYVAPEVVDTVVASDKTLAATAVVQISPPDNNTDEITVSSNASENELIGDPTGEGDDQPFILVEVKPTFRGGDLEKFREWVQKRVNYPAQAQENGIEGRVYLTFVVERDGTVTNVTIVRGVDKTLDDEAVKAISSSPKWSPGLQRGRPVRVRFSIFLNFTL